MRGVETTHPVPMYVLGSYIALNRVLRRVKTPSSAPKTMALNTRAVVNVDVDAEVASEMSELDL